jgi:hypothetical protein
MVVFEEVGRLVMQKGGGKAKVRRLVGGTKSTIRAEKWNMVVKRK